MSSKPCVNFMPDAGASRRSVPFVDFPAQFAEEREALLACVEETFTVGHFVGGEAVDLFEDAVSTRIGIRQTVALNSGTDALILSMKALGIGDGDEVITPPNSFIASTAAIIAVGARPVFADVTDDMNIDPAAVAAAITPHTQAIMPVHLTGRIADMDPLLALAEKHGLAVIEDAAQAFGSRYRDRLSCTIGHVGCFSAHPLKNLNAAGDAGFVTTNDYQVAERIRELRNHGLADRDTATAWGGVSRMDTLQAAILKMRLGTVDSVIEQRRKNADLYRARLGPNRVFAPACRAFEFNTFHTFVVQTNARDDLQRHLADQGIETAVHYPIPIHLQPAAKDLGYKQGDFPVTERQSERILSLPIHQFMSQEDIEYVVDAINGFGGAIKTS